MQFYVENYRPILRQVFKVNSTCSARKKANKIRITICFQVLRNKETERSVVTGKKCAGRVTRHLGPDVAVEPQVQRFPNCGAGPRGGHCWPSGGGVDCMRDIFILNEIWAQDKIYSLLGTLLC
jgi:hypothetical protein